MSDLPFAIYFDFETTLGKKNYNFEEDYAIYLVSYSFVVAFHSCLNLEKIFVGRSFNHSFESLIDVGYLTEELLPYFDPIMARQLKNCVIAVFNKKEQFSLSEMFSCELKFVIDLLTKWLVNKFFKRFRKLDYFTKQRFKNENPINWQQIFAC